MSNRNFDAMCASVRVSRARRSMKAWTESLARTDITAEERAFIEKCIPGTQAELADAIATLNNYR